MDAVDGHRFDVDIGYDRRLKVTYMDNNGTLQFITYKKEGENYVQKYKLFLYKSSWKKLYSMKDLVTESMPKFISGSDEAMKIELSKNIFLQMNKEYLVVDLRYYWKPEGSQAVPTKNAVSLKYVEFRKLMSHAGVINELMLGA